VNHLSVKRIKRIADAAIARSNAPPRKTGTVEKWTFQLITPRSRLLLIALARAPVMKRRETGRVDGARRAAEERSKRAGVTSRDLSISRRRGNFLNYNALISLVFLSFLLSSVCLFQARPLLGFSAWVICSTTRCGGGDNNYYASKGATAVNPIYSFSVKNRRRCIQSAF
jgi:hypothetical protein